MRPAWRTCRLDGTCAVHDAWTDAQAALATKLGDTTFEDLRREALHASRAAPQPADA